MTTVAPFQDLDAMRQRLTVRLTPEGAFNHYYNDVALLLDALQLLHSEVATTRAAFEADGAVAPENASLSVLAEAWKGQVTGYWEKAQSKKLREEIRSLKEDADTLIAEKALVEQARQRELARVDALQAEREKLAFTVADNEETYRSKLQAEQAEIIDLRDEIAKLNQALVDCSVRCEQVVALQSAQYGAQLQEATEYAKRLVELLGGTDDIRG